MRSLLWWVQAKQDKVSPSHKNSNKFTRFPSKLDRYIDKKQFYQYSEMVQLSLQNEWKIDLKSLSREEISE